MRFLIFVSLCLSLAGQGSTDLENSPRFLVHILDYIAVDYPGAVEKGKIISQGEYDEQVEFSNIVLRLAQDLPETKTQTDLHNDLLELQKKIKTKADAKEVSPFARAIAQKAVVLCKIKQAPSRWPNLHKGKELYGQNCAQCHGAEGRGDGPSGNSLDPKPADFHAEKMDDLPPFQLFNAIRLGVPGTGMASFSDFSDAQVWDLSFYVASLRYGNGTVKSPIPFKFSQEQLVHFTRNSDRTLRNEIKGTEIEKQTQVSSIRLSSSDESLEVTSLEVAQEKLELAQESFLKKNYDEARTHAILAYLNGIEPAEPRLRARDHLFIQQLESDFANVRAAIERKISEEDVTTSINKALASVQRAREILKTKESSPWFTFTIAAGIFLREGFEAALILITLLGVVRSVGASQAALSIHLGWISASVVGIMAWFFSGWILNMSGAQREILEGVVSGAAVIVLLYFGFWLHRKTEIGRWRVFIEETTRKAVSGKSLAALGGVAFLGVFRECFETVLFLRALMLEAGPEQDSAMFLGVLTSFVFVVVLSVALVRQSKKVPVRKLFQVSSVVLVFLSLILIGKMMHSFQETGIVGVTPVGLNWRSDLLGIFPTVETLASQAVVLIGILVFAFLGNQLSIKEQHAPNA